MDAIPPPPGKPPQDGLARFLASWWSWALLAVVPLLIYLPSLGHGLLFLDDEIYFRRNPLTDGGSSEGFARLWTGVHYGWSPLTHLSIWIDQRLGLAGTWFSHLHSLLLFSLGALGLRSFLARLTGSPGLAFLVALLYAVHPLSATTCLWLALRRHALCLAFLWWGLDWGLRSHLAVARRTAWTCGMAAVLLLAAAMASRFQALAAVPVLGFAMLWVRGALPRRSLLVWSLAALVCSALAGVIIASDNLASHASHRLGGSLAGTLAIDGAIIARQLAQVVWPAGMTAYYGVPEDPHWRHALAWVGVMTLVAATLLPARSRRAAAMAWLCAAALWAPTLNLVNQSFASADHYLQPALPFVLLAAALPLAAILPAGRQLIAGGLALLAAAGLGAVSVGRNREFASDLAMVRVATRASPGASFLWGYHHAVAMRSDDPAVRREGREAARRAFACADTFRMPLDDRYLCLCQALADLARDQRVEEAEALLASQGPTLGAGGHGLCRAVLALSTGRPGDALEALAPLLPTDPAAVAAGWRRFRADGLLPAAAADQEVRLDTLDPDQVQTLWRFRAAAIAQRAYQGLGHSEEGAAQALATVQLFPGLAPAWLQLAQALERLGMVEQAQAARSQAQLISAPPR